MIVPIYILTNCRLWVPPPVHPSHFFKKIKVIVTRVGWYLIVVCICISLMDSGLEEFFFMFFWNLYFILWNNAFLYSLPIKNCLFYYWVSLTSYMFWINLYWMHICEVFLPFCLLVLHVVDCFLSRAEASYPYVIIFVCFFLCVWDLIQKVFSYTKP